MSSGAAVFVLGPAGTGKSTLCGILEEHCTAIGRSAHVFNLDPAAENFAYSPSKDIRDLIEVSDAMEQYLLDNPEWLAEDLGQYQDEFLIVDLPGQIELYTHYDIVPRLLRMFQQAGYSVLVLYLMESQFMLDTTKYFGAVLNATSAMLNLGVPHLNVITKMDLIEGLPEMQGEFGDDVAEDGHPLHAFFYPDPQALGERLVAERPKAARLTTAVMNLIDEFDMVSFLPLNVRKEDSITELVAYIDHAIQFGEQLEPEEHDSAPNDGGDE